MLINTLIGGAGSALGTLIIDGVNLGSAALTALRGRAAGQAWVLMFADALGGGQDFESAAGPFLATNTAISSSWFGTAGAFGLAIKPLGVLVAVSGTSGIAAARSIAGIGTTSVASAPFGPSLIAHIGVMALDPRPGQPPTRARLRGFFRLADGRHKDFWNAAISAGPQPGSGPIKLTVDDPLRLIREAAFRRYRLPDGSQGFMLRDASGLDLAVPIPDDPDAQDPGTQVCLEASTAADSDAAFGSFNAQTLQSEFRELAAKARNWPGIVSAAIREARSAAKDDPNGAARALAVALMAAETEQHAKSQQAIVDLLTRIVGPRLVIENVPRGIYFSDSTLADLRSLRFTAIGVGNRPRLTVTVNGLRPKSLAANFDQTTENFVSGVLSWSFDNLRRGRPFGVENPPALGFRVGRNHVVVTLRSIKPRRVTSVDLFVWCPGPRMEKLPSG